ncbi:hypothetical protein M405DRAFT_817710 [Rhizopogon salebrosus TDB-379]|nr:hypothetical protein M405DRAFT_817710 [Rhizopogon salebrosus TDB-379]
MEAAATCHMRTLEDDVYWIQKTKRRRREVSKDKCNDKCSLEKLCQSLIGGGNVYAVAGPLRTPTEPRLASG